MLETASISHTIPRRTLLIATGLSTLARVLAAGVRVSSADRSGGGEFGIASWYGYPFHGRRAANGEIYDMERLTAAHRTLPFDTRVRVVNLSNERSVEVRINDRGPFVEGRVIDLSMAAARMIDLIRPGTVPVRVAIVSTPAHAPEESYAVQVGAFQDVENADRLVTRMKSQYGVARLVFRDGDPPLWRVQVGREDSQEGARALARRIRRETGEPAAFVVRRDT
jgi:rare lipoprotein A